MQFQKNQSSHFPILKPTLQNLTLSLNRSSSIHGDHLVYSWLEILFLHQGYWYHDFTVTKITNYPTVSLTRESAVCLRINQNTVYR